LQKNTKNRKKVANKKAEICLLAYVLDSVLKIKIFKTEKELNDFINNFKVCFEDGDWLNFSVTGVTGKLTFLDETFKYSICSDEEE